MRVFCINVKSRSSLAVFLLVFVLFLVLLEFVNTSSSIGNKIVTNEDRVELISSLGYTVLPEIVEEKQIIIPNKFNDVYMKYNDLQQKSGFDLKKFSGLKAYVYKYKIDGKDLFVNIILSDGVLIGGDVSSSELNGEMLPLR